MPITTLVTTGARRSRQRPRLTASAVTVVGSSSALRPAARRGRRRTRTAHGGSNANSFLSTYARTLDDPFDFGPVQMGYDCFLPTSLASAFVRAAGTVNADGSFGLVLFPDFVNMIQFSNGASGAAHAGAFASASNLSSITSNFLEVRIVSGGVRCMALFPETSAPGVLFCGTAPDISIAAYQAFSTNSFGAMPGARLGIGSRGACGTIRPYDNGSFEFFVNPVTGYASTALPYMTSVFISGIGFPVGTVIWYEAILNFEGIAKTAATSSAVPSDDVASPSMADYFPTPGNLWSAVRGALTPPVIMDGVGATYSLMRGNVGAAAGYAGRAVGRMILGSGRNFQQGNFVQERARENSVMVEEMKEDADGGVLLERLPELPPRRRR